MPTTHTSINRQNFYREISITTKSRQDYTNSQDLQDLHVYSAKTNKKTKQKTNKQTKKTKNRKENKDGWHEQKTNKQTNKQTKTNKQMKRKEKKMGGTSFKISFFFF